MRIAGGLGRGALPAGIAASRRRLVRRRCGVGCELQAVGGVRRGAIRRRAVAACTTNGSVVATPGTRQLNRRSSRNHRMGATKRRGVAGLVKFSGLPEGSGGDAHEGKRIARNLRSCMAAAHRSIQRTYVTPLRGVPGFATFLATT